MCIIISQSGIINCLTTFHAFWNFSIMKFVPGFDNEHLQSYSFLGQFLYLVHMEKSYISNPTHPVLKGNPSLERLSMRRKARVNNDRQQTEARLFPVGTNCTNSKF